MTFVVSGMLWERSLVMMDTQTRSLWSHLLGEAMDGRLKGATLEPLPSKLTTWKAWRTEHPETSVLDMSRTHRDYVKDFYRRPQDFVYGLVIDGRAYHAPFPTLQADPVVNLTLAEQALLVTFDAESASGHLFSRTLGDRTLTFVASENETMRDEETGSLWKRDTGKALSGPMKGESLEQRVGIASFTRAWMVFHPNSREIRPAEESP